MKNYEDAARQQFGVILDQFGLNKNFEIRVMETMLSDKPGMNIDIALLTKIHVPYREMAVESSRGNAVLEHIHNHFKQIKNQIAKSDHVLDLTSELQTKLDSAAEEIEILTDRVNELEKYEAHYKIEMDLRHGAGGGS